MRFDAETRAAVLKQDAVMKYFNLVGDDNVGVDTLYKIMLRMQSLESGYKLLYSQQDNLYSRIRKLEDDRKKGWFGP